MKEEINKVVESLKDEYLKDLVSLVNIPSVSIETPGNHPYGDECAKVLDKMMEIGEKKGFNPKNYDYQMVSCSVGKGDNYVCSMGHLDVVEPLEGWKYPAFGGEIHDGRIYGRGVLDNKGPVLASFYGLYALKKLGIKFNTEFRVVFGSNEEKGMNDLKYYLTKEKPPILGFAPDNKFPAIYGERARAKVEILGEYESLSNFINLNIFKGDPVKNLGIDIEDEDFGRMILRNQKLTKKGDKFAFCFDLSTPVCDIDQVIKIIKSHTSGLEVNLLFYKKWMKHDKEDLLVKVLNDAYVEMTGDKREPTTTTGMTYAHFCPNLIPYGPSFPGQNGIAHLPNEWANVDDLISCIKIYAYAFYKLNQAFKVDSN